MPWPKYGSPLYMVLCMPGLEPSQQCIRGGFSSPALLYRHPPALCSHFSQLFILWTCLYFHRSFDISRIHSMICPFRFHSQLLLKFQHNYKIKWIFKNPLRIKVIFGAKCFCTCVTLHEISPFFCSYKRRNDCFPIVICRRIVSKSRWDE